MIVEPETNMQFDIINETPNEDGTITLTIEIDDEFQAWFLKETGFEEWDDTKFQEILLEALEVAAELHNSNELLYTTVKENDEGQLYLELPETLLSDIGWTINDMIDWIPNPDQSITLINLSKKQRDIIDK